jgi:transcriptional regulator NrdR family protein
MPEKGYRRRLHRCPSCGSEFHTFEMAENEVTVLMDFAKKLKEVMK